jgi:ribose transport system permease protein
MSHSRLHSVLESPFVRDYGMVFVLLLLGVLLSVLTVREQHPTGADAGQQVARKILAAHGSDAAVIVVTRDTAEDRLFSAAAVKEFQQADVVPLSIVNGSPADVRRALESLTATETQIDAIAANDVTAKWSVYDRFPSVGAERCVTPEAYRWPDFLKLSNLKGVAKQTAIYAIIAIGMTAVIITAGIDLSVGSLVAVAAVVSALLIRDLGSGADSSFAMVLLAWLAGIAVCAVSGAFSGVMVTSFHIPPFIVTLAIMMMGSGLAFRLTNGNSIADLPPSSFVLGRGETLGVPNPVVLMLVLYGIAHMIMTRTVFGRYVYAIGGNEEAARLSGVPVKRVLIIVYTICGALAGLGGIVLMSQLSAGDPKFGLMYELEVIAAVVVGGTSLMGGRGKVLGTLIGAFIISTIKNGMNLTNVTPFNQKIVLGAVLLGAVLLDTLKRRGRNG